MSRKLDIDWSTQPLGQEPDSAIAARLGCSAPVVRRARIERGLPAFGRIDWDAEPLGQVPDGEIARRHGVTHEAVFYARKQRGIPSLLKKRPPCEPETFVAELGLTADRVVAERHGLTVGQVARARRAKGIKGARLDWDLIAPELGTAPDIVIARKYGVDNKVVASARWKRGIPKWQEERRCPCGEIFTAFHGHQKYCSYRCQRYHWQMVNVNGMEPEAADVAIALWAYKRTLAKKGSNDVEQLTGTSVNDSRCARAAEVEGDGRHDGARGGAASDCGDAGHGGEPRARPAHRTARRRKRNAPSDGARDGQTNSR